MKDRGQRKEQVTGEQIHSVKKTSVTFFCHLTPPSKVLRTPQRPSIQIGTQWRAFPIQTVAGFKEGLPHFVFDRGAVAAILLPGRVESHLENSRWEREGDASPWENVWLTLKSLGCWVFALSQALLNCSLLHLCLLFGVTQTHTDTRDKSDSGLFSLVNEGGLSVIRKYKNGWSRVRAQNGVTEW